jgi:hypothetical protein
MHGWASLNHAREPPVLVLPLSIGTLQTVAALEQLQRRIRPFGYRRGQGVLVHRIATQVKAA